jgi:hypothetical protein
MSPHLQAFNVVLLESGGAGVGLDGSQEWQEVRERDPLLRDSSILGILCFIIQENQSDGKHKLTRGVSKGVEDGHRLQAA